MPSALPQHLLGQERVGPQRSIRMDVFAINRSPFAGFAAQIVGLI